MHSAIPRMASLEETKVALQHRTPLQPSKTLERYIMRPALSVYDLPRASTSMTVQCQDRQNYTETLSVPRSFHQPNQPPGWRLLKLWDERPVGTGVVVISYVRGFLLMWTLGFLVLWSCGVDVRSLYQLLVEQSELWRNRVLIVNSILLRCTDFGNCILCVT